ncbi:ribosome biogenesis protein BOP1 homolog [Neocloeon triangulifer]|uniref:ribosome biogenesis protein BOP1 homolog n=1 Tax=Neocloeon triangulifer TaxID=2078957 RepID=UPI00286F11DB|nr:ribosome biogenesis protein BOP1 homolog [Neocloeon triangulifer]
MVKAAAKRRAAQTATAKERPQVELVKPAEKLFEKQEDDEDLLGSIASEDDDSEDSSDEYQLSEEDEEGENNEDEGGSEEVEEEESGDEEESSEGSDSDAGPSEERPDKEIEKNDEYESGDTSDEEDLRNTVGKIPMHWYDEYPLLGYDWDGKPIMKPERRDELDSFLKRMEDPNFWRTIRDPSTGQDVVLSGKDLNLVRRLQESRIPNPEHEEYKPWIEWFSSKVLTTALRPIPESKKSFLPSRSEREKVSKMVHALRMGWREPRAVLEERRAKEKEEGPKFYEMWGAEGEEEKKKRGIIDHIPAPKRTLPGHAESYNPPAEYLFTERELEQWNRQSETPWKRKVHFIPQKFPSLRAVPAYPRYVKERFLRCLDLYMAPRARKNKLTIEAEDLLPELPDPKDLQPFPTAQSLVYTGHTDMVRTICPDPSGQFLVSGSDDCSARVWEVSTGRCLKIIAAGAEVTSVSWNPSSHLSLLAIAAGKRLLLCSSMVGDAEKLASTDELLSVPPDTDPTVIVPERVQTAVKWEQAEGADWDAGQRVVVTHFKELKQVVWHGRGDYMAVVVSEGQNRSVIVHQVSKRRSQIPFNKARGLVQCVQFHPVRPLLFVATQRTIRIYDLVKQQLIKKLLSNSAWISSMSVHPGGDNLLVGCYDCKSIWFDLDLSVKPYLNLRLHSAAVRNVAFHPRYPLFATASDDCSLIVCHARVFNDLLQNAAVTPVKKLQYHTRKDDYGVFCAAFHPTQPWLFSGGADNTIRLYT